MGSIKSSKNKLWILLGLVVLFQIGIMVILSQLRNPIDALTLQLTFSADHFFSIVHHWSSQELNAYLLHYSLDMIYPICYVLFLWELMKRCDSTPQKVYFQRMVPIPLIIGIMDELENICHLLLFWVPLSPNQTFIFIKALFSWTKWIFLFISLILISIIFIYSKRKKSSSR